MNFCILYPSEPFQIRKVDEPFKAERDHVHALGLLSALLSYEDLQQGKWKLSGDLPSGTRVIYRGWMLTVSEYQIFERLAMARGLNLLTSSEQYQSTHHLPFWYPFLKEHTPESRFFENAKEAILGLRNVSWKAFFVKDWVKSLSTGRGPVAHHLSEIADIEQQMIHFRGGLKGGYVCVHLNLWLQTLKNAVLWFIEKFFCVLVLLKSIQRSPIWPTLQDKKWSLRSSLWTSLWTKRTRQGSSNWVMVR